MSLNHQIKRIERMDELIRKGRTGSPQQFAKRMGVSSSMLFTLIRELKAIGAPIYYCRRRQTYAYQHPVAFRFGFEEGQHKTTRKTGG